MTKNKRFSLQWTIGIVSGALLLILACGFAFAIKVLIRDDGSHKRRVIQDICIVRQPPPPPAQKIKPPEPEVVKQEEFVEPEAKQEDTPDQADQSQDDGAKDENLGLDAAGGTGSDAFGLMAQKGGRSLIDGGPLVIGGGFGDASMMKKYAWYTRKIETEIRQRLLLHENNLPSDNHHVLIKITLDDKGGITEYLIYDPSGDDRLDEAVKLAMEQTRSISEPPPAGMPRTLKLRISLG